MTAISNAPEYNLGSRLRQARATAGLSLAQVATLTGISPSFLSTVEMGKSDLSVTRLMKLVHCYGLSITDIIDSPHPANLHVIRANEAKQLALQEEGISIFSLARDGHHALMPVLNEYEVGGGMKDHASHEGEEFVYVISGTLELHFGDGVPVVLKAGDSAHYTADVPHAFRNAGNKLVRFVGVATPPNI